MLQKPAAAADRPFRAIMDTMLDPLALGQPVHDAEGRVVDFICTDANPAACAFIGIERERLLNRRLLAVYPEITGTGLLARFADTARTGRPTTIDDFPCPLRCAGTRWLDIRAVRSDGQVCFGWRDNSERHEAAEKIAASEERFRLLAQNSLDVVVRIGADDRIVWVSPSITPTLGWAPADCIGRHAAELLATGPARDRYLRNNALAAAGQGVVSRARILNATGADHWVELHTSPYRAPDGHIDGVVATFRLIDAEVQMEQALEHRARTDEVTHLLNRREGLERLGALAGRRGGTIAVAWCDIDHFKSINDTHGHAAGDAVLRHLGETIRRCLRSTDDVGVRIGGDELLVILHDVRDLHEAVHVAETLRSNAARPIPVGGGTVRTTISIGVTVGRPDESIDALLARADDAMYRAKAAGRNQVVALPPPDRDGRAA